MNDNKPLVLLIDMDGVLYDWYGGFHKEYVSLWPERKAVAPTEITSFFIEEHFDEEFHEDIYDIIRSMWFYENLDTLPGAIEGMALIQRAVEAKELDAYICSSPEIESDGQSCWSEKAFAVERDFGEFWLKRLILTKDKTLVRGHILLDDKPHIKGSMEPTWQHLLFEQPYNQEVDKPRFTWEDTQELISSLKPVAPVQESRIILLS